MLATQRHLFDIPPDVAYFNCAYMSPLMHRVIEAGDAGARRKARPWTIAAQDFFTEAERARALFATLVGASAHDVALVPAASYGIALAARGLPLAAGERVVVLADQFPSNVYAWRELARDAGGEVQAVPRPAGGTWTDGVLAAIDERVRIVALPHCHWTDGTVLDLEAIGERCRAAGAALVLDLTQSAGAFPFDVAAVQPDYAIAASYKWLLGPYSMGFTYVAPHRQGAVPLEHNWIDRAGSEDFSGLVAYRDDYQPGARRFDVGERANFQLLPMVVAALEQILEWGVAEIAGTLAARTAGIAARLRPFGLEPTPEDLRAGHFLGARIPGGVPPDLTRRLAAEQVHVSVRGESLRITPHVYNTDEDVDRLLDALSAAL